jgi:hypothetical protein
MRAATVLRLTRSPASRKSVVIRGAPYVPLEILWELMILASRPARRTSLGSAGGPGPLSSGSSRPSRPPIGGPCG